MTKKYDRRDFRWIFCYTLESTSSLDLLNWKLIALMREYNLLNHNIEDRVVNFASYDEVLKNAYTRLTFIQDHKSSRP